jgi:glutaminyl-tRNA synthetase
MSSPNMILRDPVIYRIIEKDHHTTGNKWKIYPMYDFAHPLSDYVEGITDSLCTLEFEVHYPLYCWILNNCNLEKSFPVEKEFSRLNLEYTVLSKRKLKELVEDNFVSGFDDPRMPTIAGMRNRGFSANSIKNFCEKIGVTRVDALSSILLLEECLRDDLNKTSNRIMGVHNPVKLVITNWENNEEVLSIENNPESENPTTRNVTFSKELFIERDDFKEEADNKFFRLKLGSEVRLKGAYVIKANEVIKENGEITEIRCTYDPASKSGNDIGRKIKGTIHWVSVEHAVNLDVNEYDTLFTESNLDELEDFTTCINPNSLVVNTKSVFEPHVLNLKEGIPVQMMRKGYYIYDKEYKSLIKTVSLKENWK